MTPGNLIPQDLSRELDGCRSVSDHRGRARDVREHRNSDALMRHASDNTHHAFARVFERSAADVNVLDVHGFHQFQTPHSTLPKRANHPMGNLGKCGALAASEFGSHPQSYAVPIWNNSTFGESMSSAKNAGVHLSAIRVRQSMRESRNSDIRFNHGENPFASAATGRASWRRSSARTPRSPSERLS